MRHLLTFSILLLLVQLGSAQVSVNIKMDRDDFLAHEPISAVVTITNRSGRLLELASKAEGSLAYSWLDFSIRDSAGRDLIKATNKVYQRAVIPAGRSMSRRVYLSSMYPLHRVGNYAVTAHVRQPRVENSSYTSNSGHFNVAGGSNIYKQGFGVAGKVAPKREYNVITFNDGRRTSIFAQVMNTQNGRSISTVRLSEYLSFVKPDMALDGNNALHILYLASAEVFVHTTISQDGGHVGTEYFRRAGGRNPRFVAFADGKLAISGAIKFDPAAEKAQAATARNATDRPE